MPTACLQHSPTASCNKQELSQHCQISPGGKTVPVHWEDKCYANGQSIIMHSKEESHIAEWRKPEWTWYIFHIYILSIRTENQLIHCRKSGQRLLVGGVRGGSAWKGRGWAFEVPIMFRIDLSPPYIDENLLSIYTSKFFFFQTLWESLLYLCNEWEHCRSYSVNRKQYSLPGYMLIKQRILNEL